MVIFNSSHSTSLLGIHRTACTKINFGWFDFEYGIYFTNETGFFSYFDKCGAQVKISKQEAHGPQRSNKNQFKSMNTGTFERSYDCIYYKTGPVVQEEEIL